MDSQYAILLGIHASTRQYSVLRGIPTSTCQCPILLGIPCKYSSISLSARNPPQELVIIPCCWEPSLPSVALVVILLRIPHRYLSKPQAASRNSLLVERRTRDRKVASSNPGRGGGRIFCSRVNFVCCLIFGVHSCPMLPQWQIKDPGHSAKSGGGTLHLNTHTPFTQQSLSGLTMPLSRHSVGIYQERAPMQHVMEHSVTDVSAG